jgi:hypothetical protein
MTEKGLTTTTASLQAVNSNEMLFNVQMFEHAQRVSKLFATSSMVPDHFKNNVGNCFIALNIASRMQLDPFMVMQKMYIIHGKPGIESQLIIALINKSGLFTPLQYRMEGEDKEMKCTAYATHNETGEVCSQTVTWDMVEAEGWNKKPGSKWNTLPELMFRYRAAAFFARVYCPEVIMGMKTSEELHDTVHLYKKADGTYSSDVKSIADQKLQDAMEKSMPKPEAQAPKQKQEPAKEKPESNPWDYDNYKRLKAGDGEKTGYAVYVKKHADTFESQPEGVKKKAIEKWDALYPHEPFPLLKKELEPVGGENATRPGQDPEPDRKIVKIYGVEGAEGFEREYYEYELEKWAKDIWEHPSKYSDYTDGTGEAYYNFLKYLWIKYPDGTDERLDTFVNKISGESAKLENSQVQDRYTCPDGKGIVPSEFCNNECNNREGCPAHE